MNRKFISLAVSGALLTFSSFSVFAAVDLDGGGSFTYSKELVSAAGNKITGATTTACPLVNTAANEGFKVEAGTLIPGGANAQVQRHVRIDLIGGKFSGVPTIKAETASTTLTHAVVQGGDGHEYVIFSVVGDNDITQTESFLIGLTGVELDAGVEQLGLKYGVYVEADNAFNLTQSLYNKTYDKVLTLAESGSAPSIAITPAVSAEIDPAANTLFVNGVKTTDLSNLKVTLPSGLCGADGTAAEIDEEGKLTVSGDFSAFATAPGEVFLNGSDNCNATDSAVPGVVNSAADTVTFSFDNANTTGNFGAQTDAATNLNNVHLCVTVDEVTSIVDGSYECTIEYKVKDGTSTSDAVTSDPIACGNLQFAGSSDRVNWGLTPGGAFKQFFRISNPSSVTGDVTVTLVNDAGQSVSFPLDKVDGISSSELAAGASTSLISIDDLAAADSSFNVNGGKIRVIVRGEFGDDIESNGNTFGDANSTDGIVIEAVGINPANGNALIME